MRWKKDIFDLPVVILVCLIIFTAICNYFWLHMNLRPPVDDEANHLFSALEYLRILRHPSLHMLSDLGRVDFLYPPLFPFIAALGSLLLGKTSIVLFCMTNLLFFSILFFSLYFIGLKVGNKWLGVLAACFLSLYPMVFNLGRMFMLEIALVCMVTLTIALLMYSEGFSKRNMSLWAGISLGLGLLTKETYAVFMVGPVIYFFFESFSGVEASQRKERFRNFILFLAVGILVAVPWYLFNAGKVFDYLRFAAFDTAAVSESFPILSTRSLFYYFGMLVNAQVLGIFFAAFVIALFFAFRQISKCVLFVVWIGAGYMLLSLFPNKYCYYTLSFLSAVAILTAYGFLSIRSHSLRRAVIALFLIFGAVQFFGLSFFAPSVSSRILHRTAYSPGTLSGINFDDVIDSIIRKHGPEKVVLGTIRVDSNMDGNKAIDAGDAYTLINDSTWKYFVALKGLSWRVHDMREGIREKKKIFGGASPDFIISAHSLEQEKLPLSMQKQYVLTDVFELADYSQVYLYKFSKAIPVEAQTQAILHKRDKNVEGREDSILRWVRAGNRWLIFWKDKEVTRILAPSVLMTSFQQWRDVLYQQDESIVQALHDAFIRSLQEWKDAIFFKNLSADSIWLALDNHAWKIFWKGTEITKQLSVYTSMRVFGKWVDSRQCEWFVIKRGKRHVTAVAHKSSFPLIQLWDFTLEKHRIYWKVRLFVLGRVRIDREQANVMLTDQYTHWATLQALGEFPVIFNKDYGGDWQVLKEIKPGPPEHVGAFGNGALLPKVDFYCVDPREGLLGNVINSDDQFKGRVLQYAVKHGDSFFRSVGTYEYFNGYIDLDGGK